MFTSAVRSALLALVSSAIAVQAAPGLSVQVGGSGAVDGVDNFKVTTVVTNTGDETLKLLNHPNGPLSQFPTETFSVNHEDTGASPDFVGVKVRFLHFQHCLTFLNNTCL